MIAIFGFFELVVISTDVRRMHDGNADDMSERCLEVSSSRLTRINLKIFLFLLPLEIEKCYGFYY